MDEFRRMADLAAEPDRKARLRVRMGRDRPSHHLRDGKIARAVGQLDHLFQQAVRRVESRMHVPQRAGAAEFENGKVPDEKRLETLPALLTRSRKNGMPRAFGRDRVVSRWQTCSKPALKR